ncbi:efflux RND transporter periplasmic adaptor subunit [Thioclava sp. GXIMD2076]|uniref:efflux RND transporter periplasmic adaptor subunit n=1 Tax=Thioclava sp. GXIMD2076 TaxID=3131931 RepID=UPI0030D159A4
MRAALAFVALLATPALAQDLPAADPPRPVITEIIGEVTPGRRVFSGMVEARYETSLAFRTGGRIARLHVEAGDRVEKGAVIAELDQITLEQDLREARASTSQAQAALDYAQASFDRAATLRQRGVIAQSEFETAQASLASAKADLESARAQERQSAQAASYGKLTAPSDGIILSRSVEPGTLVSAGTEVVSFARGDAREAVIDLPRALAASLPADQGFLINHHADDIAPIRAKLRLIEPVTNSSLDTMRAHLTLEAPAPDYRIGSLVSARLDNGAAELLSLPEAALMDGPSVWIVSGDPRKVHRQSVSTGARLGNRITITEGLKSGDEVVLRGREVLTEGETVGAGLTVAGKARPTTLNQTTQEKAPK